MICVIVVPLANRRLADQMLPESSFLVIGESCEYRGVHTTGAVQDRVFRDITGDSLVEVHGFVSRQAADAWIAQDDARRRAVAR
jgi:hypothetical protein